MASYNALLNLHVAMAAKSDREMECWLRLNETGYQTPAGLGIGNRHSLCDGAD